jgi:hypothetical protein
MSSASPSSIQRYCIGTSDIGIDKIKATFIHTNELHYLLFGQAGQPSRTWPNEKKREPPTQDKRDPSLRIGSRHLVRYLWCGEMLRYSAVLEVAFVYLLNFHLEAPAACTYDHQHVDLHFFTAAVARTAIVLYVGTSCRGNKSS